MKTPQQGVPSEVWDDLTGRYDGAERARLRAKRPTEERIGRLEEKHDRLTETVTEVRVCIGEMSGKLDTFIDALAADRRESHATERVRIGSRAKVVVGVVGAVCTAIGAALASMAGCA